MRKTISSIGVTIALLASSALPALAQTPGPGQLIDLKGTAPGGGAARIANLTAADIISGLIRLLVIAAAVIFFVWLVLGGIRWITSGGDKAKTEEARNQITAALVGLVVVFSAWAIAQLIKTLFGVDILGLTITPF